MTVLQPYSISSHGLTYPPRPLPPNSEYNHTARSSSTVAMGHRSPFSDSDGVLVLDSRSPSPSPTVTTPPSGFVGQMEDQWRCRLFKSRDATTSPSAQSSTPSLLAPNSGDSSESHTLGYFQSPSPILSPKCIPSVAHSAYYEETSNPDPTYTELSDTASQPCLYTPPIRSPPCLRSPITASRTHSPSLLSVNAESEFNAQISPRPSPRFDSRTPPLIFRRGRLSPPVPLWHRIPPPSETSPQSCPRPPISDRSSPAESAPSREGGPASPGIFSLPCIRPFPNSDGHKSDGPPFPRSSILTNPLRPPSPTRLMSSYPGPTSPIPAGFSSYGLYPACELQRQTPEGGRSPRPRRTFDTTPVIPNIDVASSPRLATPHPGHPWNGIPTPPWALSNVHSPGIKPWPITYYPSSIYAPGPAPAPVLIGGTPAFPAPTPIPQRDFGATPSNSLPDNKKSGRYYFEDGNVVFQINQTLFKVHGHFFRQHSPVLGAKLGIYQARFLPEWFPIPLPDVEPHEFELLLSIFYPTNLASHDAQTVDEWSTILRLADQYEMQKVRSLAITHLESIAPVVDKIKLANTYNIREWLVPAYMQLCTRSEALTLEEGKKIGVEAVVVIGELRKQLLDGVKKFVDGTSSATKKTCV